MDEASDLRDFDVPDPVRPAGSFRRSLVISLVALGGAVAFLQVTALDHYFAALEATSKYRRPRIRGMIDEGWPPEVVRERIDHLRPEARGGFHRALAASGEEDDLAAILAWLRAADHEYDRERRLRVASPSLVSFPPEVAARPLLAYYGELVELGSEEAVNADRLARAIRGAWEPGTIAAEVLGIRDSAGRGRFHEVLAATGDARHVKAILAHVGRSSSGTSPIGELERDLSAEIGSLRAFGPDGVPALVEGIRGGNRAAAVAAAVALREVDPVALVRTTEELLDEHPRVSGEDRSRVATSILVCLEAISPLETSIEGDLAVDFCYIQGLSLFDEEIATRCARALGARLTTSDLVDTLFRYIAAKERFNLREVEVYENLMVNEGAEAADRVAVNLERLLEEAGDRPGEVFWFYKALAYRVLLREGTPNAIPVLERYRDDPGSYVHETIHREHGVDRPEREVVEFTEEVRETIRAIRERAGEPPGKPPKD